MKKKILIFSIIAVALLTLVSFSSAVGYNVVKNTQEEIITDEFDFEYCKEYLFETIVEISNNEDVKDLINSNNKVSLSVEKLDLLYKMGLKLIDRLGKEKVLEILSNANPEFNEQLDTIIMGDEELRERIYTLNEMNVEDMSIPLDWKDTPIICFILLTMMMPFILIMSPVDILISFFYDIGLVGISYIIQIIFDIVFLPLEVILAPISSLFIDFGCFPF